jgi:hypothetical protein
MFDGAGLACLGQSILMHTAVSAVATNETYRTFAIGAPSIRRILGAALEFGETSYQLGQREHPQTGEHVP